MSLPSPKTLIAAFSLGAVLSVAVIDFGRTAPGELSTAHARVDDLASSASCNDCHGGWTSTMTASCLECHETIQAHLDGGLGLHGILDPALAADCATCHSEHHGRAFTAVNAMSFARAGIADVQQFDHSLVGFDMSGAHLEEECTSCHEHAEANPVPEGEHRYVGLDQSCASCHEDPHEGAYSTTCVVCHVQESFETHLFVGHDRFLPLVGGHAELDCATCHEPEGGHSLSILRGPAGARPEGRTCADCHEQPHEEAFVQGAARVQGVSLAAQLVGVERNVSCSGCHEPQHTSFQQDAEDLTPEEHAASGFPLALPHDQVDCASCHEPALAYEERYPGRDIDTCAACHEDPHGGQFAGLAFAPAGMLLGGAVDQVGCLVCHSRTHFDPHNFDVAAHADTDLPLEGAHVKTDCNACHDAPAPEAPRIFHGVDHTCDSCHDDAHRGFFDAALAAAEEPAPAHGDCARCHDPTGFDQVPEEQFDHAAWTGYALTGSHAAAACTTCHERAAEADAAGRTFGVVTEVWGEVTGCVTCHDDVHEGRFDEPGLPAEVKGRSDCARCHDTATFRDLPHGFDHGRWAGWTLVDAHLEADCSACHAPLRRPDEVGRTWGRAAGRDCASCHDSPHGDQFDAPEPLACASCHRSAESFGTLHFDHDRDTRFPLDEAHETVSCSGCHTLDEAAGVVRYRPLSRECVDCHGEHEKALRRRRRRR